jgi:replication-associated recombination protein RarA
MIALDLPLIGPAVSILETARALARQRDRVAILLHGPPGVGKTHMLDLLALEIAGSKFAVEQINGQSLGIEVVREWRDRAPYGNLFSEWSVKRVDELDHASSSAAAELLTYLDYLHPRKAVLATTNDYARLRAAHKGRLETRFVVFRVDAPSIEDAAAYLRERFKVPAKIAREIAAGAVPDGCLPSEGCNMRACVEDAKGYLAARSITPLRVVESGVGK